MSEVTRRAREAAEGGDREDLEAIRKKCRHIVGFTEFRFPRYQTGRHHRLIGEQLERVQRREIDRLMLLLPPRHGKSELASKSFPAHCLGLDPTEQFISASAGNELARDWGREVRNIVMSEEYQAVFPHVTLAEDSKAAGKWHTRQGGSYYAVGVGSSILGRGANKVMIDDPFGSMEDAESEVIREKVWKWYCGTIYNRLQPGGAIVLIGHRLHPDDLHGRLIEQMKAGGDYADRWEIVNLPAIAQEPSDLNVRAKGLKISHEGVAGVLRASGGSMAVASLEWRSRNASLRGEIERALPKATPKARDKIDLIASELPIHEGDTLEFLELVHDNLLERKRVLEAAGVDFKKRP